MLHLRLRREIDRRQQGSTRRLRCRLGLLRPCQRRGEIKVLRQCPSLEAAQLGIIEGIPPVAEDVRRRRCRRERGRTWKGCRVSTGGR